MNLKKSEIINLLNKLVEALDQDKIESCSVGLDVEKNSFKISLGFEGDLEKVMGE